MSNDGIDDAAYIDYADIGKKAGVANETGCECRAGRFALFEPLHQRPLPTVVLSPRTQRRVERAELALANR
jgi:hypothetical protein